MAQTPPIFVAAAAWAQSRPFGCSAGRAVREILWTLTGPPRVAACSLSTPVPLNLAGTIAVQAAWPVTQPGIDVCFLVHPADPPPRVRSRLAQGPALFIRVPSVTAISLELIDQDELLQARVRILAGELTSLALRHPELSGQLTELAGAAPADLAPVAPAIAVIGPVPAACHALKAALADDYRVVDSGDVDAVVAVAAPDGWSPADLPTLADAAGRVGRLISTAPLPPGLAGSGMVAARGVTEVPLLLAQLLAQPRAGTTPDPEPGNWRRAMGHLRRRGLKKLEQEVNACTQTSQLAAVAQRHGLGTLPDRGWVSRAEPLVVGLVSGVGLGRLLWAVHPVFSVVVAVLAGLIVAWLRWRAVERRALKEAAAELRNRWLEPDITSRRPDGPIGWVKRQMVVRE